MNMDWENHFTERELSEIKWCQLYDEQFKHGADGHNRMVIVSKLCRLLEAALGPPQESVGVVHEKT